MTILTSIIRTTSTSTLLLLLITITKYQEVNAQEAHSCSLYLAPTSTVQNPSTITYDDDYYDDETSDEMDDLQQPIKLSMYAGVNLEPGSVIGSPELGIPVIDIDLHNRLHEIPDANFDYFSPQSDFMWTADTVGAKYEIYPEDSEEDENSSRSKSGSGLLMAIPGIGSLGNDFSSMVNSDWYDPSVIERGPPTFPSSSSRFSTNNPSYHNPPKKSYTRGAYTNYYNITLKATRYISAGSEILTDLGNNWDYDDNDERLKPEDYDDVDSTLHKIYSFLLKHRDTKGWTKKKERRVYKFLVDEVIQAAGTQSINYDDDRSNKRDIRRKIARLFPKEPSEFEEYLSKPNGGSFIQNNPELQKSISWLQENGQCLDGLYNGPSTIPDAGKGAFARVAITKGSLVAPAPLLLIQSTSYMDMYSTKIFQQRGKHTQYGVRDKTKNNVIHRQMLTNYCFGHPQSSLLFYPYGSNTNFINHKSEGNGANAKIVWTQQSYHQSHLLEKHVNEVVDDVASITGLGFDIIATRDIIPDEEVFIDYGNEWEDAWQAHIRNWEDDVKLPKKALDINADMEYFKTTTELSRNKDDSIPKNVMTSCMILIEGPVEDARLQELYESNIYKFVVKKDWVEILRGNHMKECDILERYQALSDDGVTTEYLYTVLSKYDGIQDVIIDVPQRAIRFVDKPYTSDHHMKRSFRHSIHIPDDIFPQQWRDLK